MTGPELSSPRRDDVLAVIHRALGNGHLASAKWHINAAQKEFPDDAAFDALEARLGRARRDAMVEAIEGAVESGDFDGAADQIRNAQSEFPNDRTVRALRIQVGRVRRDVVIAAIERAVESGDFDGAADQISAARTEFPDDRTLAAVEARATRTQRLAALTEIRAALDNDEVGTAIDRIRDAQAVFADDTEVRGLASRAGIMRGREIILELEQEGLLTAALAILTAEHERNPTDLIAGYALKYFLGKSGDSLGEARLMDRLEPPPVESGVIGGEENVGVDGALTERRAFKKAERRLLNPARSWEHCRAAAFLCLGGASVDEAPILLDALAALPLDDRARTVVELVTQSQVRNATDIASCEPELQAQISAELASISRSAGPIIEYGADSDTTVILFGRGDFAVDKAYVHWLIRAAGHNLVYVLDNVGLFLMDGIDGVAGGLDGAVDHLAEMNHRLGTQRLVTLGQSGYGYAAIRYGLRVGAQGVLPLGAATRIDAVAARDTGSHLLRWLRLQQELPGEFGSLRAEIAAQPEVALKLIYGETSEPDRLYIEEVADLPNVAVHLLPGHSEHNVMLPALADGSLSTLLAELFVPR